MSGSQSSEQLMLSRDRKVSPISRLRWWKGVDLWVPAIRNSFGLPAGTSCPGKTEFCRSCYAKNTERQWPGVSKGMARNLALLESAENVDGMAALIDNMVGRFAKQAARWGLTRKQWVFRIHWDGDFFSLDYAEAWAHVMRCYPEITFWAYTRSFIEPVNVVPILVGVENLSLYLSVDEYNVDVAGPLSEQYPALSLALCGIDYVSARALVESRPMPPIVCPENKGDVALVDDEGVGACVTCQLCPVGRRDIIFSTTHVEIAKKNLTLFPAGVA